MSSKRQKSRKSQSRDNKGKTMRSREAIKSSKSNLRLDLEPPKGSQGSPKRPPRAPKRSPRELQSGLANIFNDWRQLMERAQTVTKVQIDRHLTKHRDILLYLKRTSKN